MIIMTKPRLINGLFFIVLVTSILFINHQNIHVQASDAWLLHGVGLGLYFTYQYKHDDFSSKIFYKTMYFSTLGFTLLFPLGLVLNEPSSLFKTTSSIYILFLIILLLIKQKDQNNTKELPDCSMVIVTLLGACEIGTVVHSYLFS